MIILDLRETKLIELFNASSIQYKTEQLPIGDIIIRYIHNDTTYEIILERKCVTDMVASIKDGRYKEQKLRLLAERHASDVIKKVKIAYLVEGLATECRNVQDKVMLLGSVISSIFRDDIPVLRTVSLQETSELITRLHERLIKDFLLFFPETSNTSTTRKTPNQDTGITVTDNSSISQDTSTSITANNANNAYLASIKKNKKDNMTPQLWNQNCLCGIPGVSNAIACKITDLYPTVKSLLDAYSKCSTPMEKETMLADIVLTETDKQRRRIGGVVSKRIYEYLH